MSGTDPLALLSSTLSITEPFSEGSKKIASFVRRTEERFEPPEMIRSLLGNTIDARMQEYMLFCLLDISRADFDMLEKAARLRQLRHLTSKFRWNSAPLTDTEQSVIATLPPGLNPPDIEGIIEAARAVTTLVTHLERDLPIDESDAAALSCLMTLEADALKARSEWLSDHVDSYNMRAIARILPLLTVCDEETCTLREIGERIGRGDRLGRPILTFEYAMRTDSFEKWLKKASKDQTAGGFLDLLRMQRTRLVPVRNLVAVATLSRCLHSPSAPALTWIRHALENSTPEGFKIDAGNDIGKLKRHIERCAVEVRGTIISGSFEGASFIPLIGTDMLTRKEEHDDADLSPRELVARCINNDLLLIRLLENPRISGAPGVVQHIATVSRSLSVLQKIALTGELYSGYANNGVPLALLRNPTHLPLNLLRPFINIRHVPFNDLKAILNNPYGIRPDVLQEVKQFISQRYA
jgi:hypothetical protein